MSLTRFFFYVSLKRLLNTGCLQRLKQTVFIYSSNYIELNDRFRCYKYYERRNAQNIFGVQYISIRATFLTLHTSTR